MYLNKKTLLMIISVLVFTITIAYALLSKNLNVSGTTSIDSNFDIRITNIVKKAQNGTPTETNQPTYSSTNASFNVGFTTPGEYITYEITVENLGTLDATLNKINITKENSSAIIYTINGIKEGNSLLVSEKKKFTIKIEYNNLITAQPAKINSSISLNLNFIQNLTNTTNNDTEEKIVGGYDYEIGDIIEYAGSNWYVIKNSTMSEDYVVLLKEKVLSREELTNNYTCNSGNAMAYYWSDTCHGKGTYGLNTYDSSNTTNCDGYDYYNSSKVKEMLENAYLPSLGANNLKQIDGYKIRLIKNEELVTELYYTQYNLSRYVSSSLTPQWIYQNFGAVRYWTMSSKVDNSRYVWSVSSNGISSDNHITEIQHAIRPVINLYKSAITN